MLAVGLGLEEETFIRAGRYGRVEMSIQSAYDQLNRHVGRTCLPRLQPISTSMGTSTRKTSGDVYTNFAYEGLALLGCLRDSTPI